jgi:hypothetical protein
MFTPSLSTYFVTDGEDGLDETMRPPRSVMES